jgi:HEAT repeat protein
VAKKQRGDSQALSEILGNESAPCDDRIAAAKGLGNLGTLAGTVGAEALFSAQLGDPNKQHKYGNTEAERMTANGQTFVRLAAIGALSKLDVLAAPYVIKMIQSSQQASTYNPEVKTEVGQCIHHLGSAAVPPLLDALSNNEGDASTRVLAATWMHHLGAALLPHIDEVIKALQTNQATEDEKMRIMIVSALGNIGCHHSTPDGIGKGGPVSKYEATPLPAPAVDSKTAEQHASAAAALIKAMREDGSEMVQVRLSLPLFRAVLSQAHAHPFHPLTHSPTHSLTHSPTG